MLQNYAITALVCKPRTGYSVARQHSKLVTNKIVEYRDNTRNKRFLPINSSAVRQ